MLAKAIQSRKSKHGRLQDFTARVVYPCRTAAAVELANLAGSWRDAAVQMNTTADLAPYLRNRSYHIILTFGEGEQPSDREIFDAGHSTVDELGASEHQYVMAIHKNRINVHLHIVCNRVHPISGLVLPTSHDFARLELACRRIENRNGWPQDRGRFECKVVDDEVLLAPQPRCHWERKTEARKLGLRPDGRAVRRLEQRTGLPPLRDLLSPKKIVWLRRSLDASKCWQDVHQTLSENGLKYEMKGPGARISRLEGPFFMPAGQIGSSYTLNGLEDRIGKFAPADTMAEKPDKVASEKPIAECPFKDLSPIEAAVHFVKVAVKDIRCWRHNRAAARKTLRAAQKIESQQVRDLLRGRRTLTEKALRHGMNATHHEQMIELRTQYPAPHPMPFDATNHVARLAPEELNGRRYRHIHRAMAMSDCRAHNEAPMDHTWFRQAWHIAQPKDVVQLPRRIRNTILCCPNDLRIDHHGNLLFARRNTLGSIVGFAVCQAQDLFAGVDQPIGSGDGLCLIGPRFAAEVVVVTDVVSGLIRAAEWITEPELIIVAEVGMTPRMKQLLNALRSNRVADLIEQRVSTEAEPAQDATKTFDTGLEMEPNASEPQIDDANHPELEIDGAPTGNGPTP
jgi:hypothetical protein